MGFPVPVYNWLSTGLNAWVNELFSSPNEPIFSFLDRELVLAQINLGTKTKSPQIEKHRLWNLIILNLWMREWLQP
jgi:asparagine synthase (glutamine-hydrolysing)